MTERPGQSKGKYRAETKHRGGWVGQRSLERRRAALRCEVQVSRGGSTELLGAVRPLRIDSEHEQIAEFAADLETGPIDECLDGRTG